LTHRSSDTLRIPGSQDPRIPGSQNHKDTWTLRSSDTIRITRRIGSSQRQLGQALEITRWLEESTRRKKRKEKKPKLLGIIRTQFSHYSKSWIPHHT